METTIMGYMGIIGYILGLYMDNGKYNGNYYSCDPAFPVEASAAKAAM